MKHIFLKVSLIVLIACLLITSALATYGPANTWVPSWGTATAYDSNHYTGAVYMLMSFGWDDDESLSGCMSDTNETLEVEFLFYDYDYNAYTKYDYGDNTQGTYWETNQPRPYHDTTLCDLGQEVNFCIGCSDANEFEIDTYYYWWSYGVKTSNGSKAKVNVQTGHRTPSNVYESCWFVFGDQTHTIVPYSQFNTPGSKNWTY